MYGSNKVHSKRQGAPKKVKAESGKFRSILKERSMASNLMLDVQNIRQEIQSLVVARDLLFTRIVRHWHERSGSLMLKVRGFYDAFRQGWAINDGRRKFSRSAHEQRGFLSHVMDENVWIGNNMSGVSNMVKQMRILDLRMHGYNIVDTEDSTVIKSFGVLRFQIARATILEIFPYVLRHSDLLDRIIGRRVDAPIAYKFYLNAKGMITRYELDLEMVSAFTSLLQDPEDVAVLLGQALIYENCMHAGPAPGRRGSRCDERHAGL